jgi:hypothetical protein
MVNGSATCGTEGRKLERSPYLHISIILRAKEAQPNNDDGFNNTQDSFRDDEKI